MNGPPQNPTAPNVVLICCDHLRADWLGCGGHPIVQTPQIDKLASQGVLFERAFSESPICVPARRILMTGLDTYGIHLSRNHETQPFDEGPKLAQVMTAAGYQTFASGKLHTFPQRNRIGFEDVQLNEEGRRSDCPMDDYEAFLQDRGYAHLVHTHGLGNNQYGLRLNPLPEPLTTTHWTAQKAMEFIERRDPTRPFFLHLSFDKPHPPIVPPQSYYELYRGVDFPDPIMGDWVAERTPSRVRYLQAANEWDRWSGDRERIQQCLRGFAAMITHIDSMIGIFLGQLRERKLNENTLVVFTSDHGDQLFDHGNFAKGDFFRGSTNIPFIVRPPLTWSNANGIELDRVDRSAPVGLQDVMPTILDMCGLAIPDSVHGSSLVPLLQDARAPFREYTFGHVEVAYGVSDGRYRYQWFSDDDLEFLFDIDSDPSDCHDLARSLEHRAVLERMRGKLIEWMARNGDPKVVDGKLVPVPHDWKLDRGRVKNLWANRGRH